ncbi:MAG: toll/interleukin-1 receptor domain-containing protein [Chitinophagaceae bacterium]|nr:toll/interleukin-1 receptor domain-containing protein [Chitinophagaceae bacterium]
MFKAWEKAPRADRVFISYASEDKFDAAEVKKALQKQGYKVFTYLSSSNKKVTCPKKIAYYLASAGNSFVIDTKTSRLKYGVISEALCYQKYKLDIVKTDFERKDKLRSDFEKKIASYEEFKTKVADYNDIKMTDPAYERKLSTILREEYGVVDKASYDAVMNRSLNKIYYQDIDKVSKTVSKYYPKMSAAEKSSILTSVLTSSTICPRCHLPYAFPICLAGRRR